MGVKTAVLIILVMSVLLSNRARAQTGCTMAMVSLSPCLNYVTGNSTAPSTSCCTRLSTLVDSQPQCLCALLKGGASSLGIAINQTLALALPAACNVQTPPVSQCNAVNGPANSGPAPTLPPSDDGTLEDPPSDSDFPSGAGSKTDDGFSVGGSNNGAKSSYVGVFLLLASSLAFSGTGF
ncbi:hypothetical protein ABFX02_04G031600 [Erythranthe guttata]